MYQQAIFALEEVILITPYAWNVSNPILNSSEDVDLAGRYMLASEKFYTWQLQLAMLLRIDIWQSRLEDSVEVLSYVTIICVAIMG